MAVCQTDHIIEQIVHDPHDQRPEVDRDHDRDRNRQPGQDRTALVAKNIS